jgi:hypothetical protein
MPHARTPPPPPVGPWARQAGGVRKVLPYINYGNLFFYDALSRKCFNP